MSQDSVRTLRTMWGKGNTSEASSSAPQAPSAPSAPSASPAPPASSSAPAPTRKRRKKDPGGAGQARLTVSVNGVGVGPPEKRSRKGGAAKPQDDSSDDIIEIGPPYSIVSPDSSTVASSPPRHDEVVVTGSSGAPRSKGRPKKIVFATDTKAPHAFFSRAGRTNIPTASDMTSEPATLETLGTATTTSTVAGSVPGSASASAATSVAQSGTATHIHSFFAARQSGLRKGWGCCREGEEPVAPWPGGEWPSHVDFVDSQPVPSRLALRQKPPANGRDAPDAASTLYSLLRPSSPLPSRPTHSARPASFPPFVLDHPAIQAVKPTNNRETWCEAHRPRTASAVLGNELEATYLRDWLAALSVGSREARRVIRRVPRRKAVDPDTSWIVDDTFAEPFTDDAYYDDELPEPEDEPQFPLGGRPDKYPVIDYWIGNALLLTGPSGCGKSAAVYAAAEELGWDVFEVYPGIGKRTGAHLLSLVGEVGKNHMVGERKENRKDTAKAAAKAFFGGATATASPSGGGSASDPIALDDTPVKEKPDYSQEKEVKTKQSLILIDEADILFEEESTFWPAVVSLIAESRRPVVITCNDLSRIPRDSLPIHTTLYFLPPPSYLAQPYLAAIASAHGVEVDVAELYAQCTRVPIDLVDQPLPPSGHEPAALFDLRAAINELQLDRGVRDEPHTPRIERSGDLAAMARALDAVSLADAQIGPRPWERMEVCEIDRLAPTGDDEDGIHQLLKPDIQHLHPALAAYAHSSDMARTLVSVAGGHLVVSNKATRLNMAQTAYTRHILPVLDEVVTLAGRLLPHPTLYLETMPFLRILVQTDDMLEAADRAAVASGTARVNRQGRVVRGTARAYERHLAIEERALMVAREEVLTWSG